MSDTLLGGPAASESSNVPASPPASPPADQGGPANGDWTASLPDDLRGVAEAKGWKEPADALRSYAHLESVFGADKAGRTLLMPKSGEDAEALDKIYSALGRPEKPDEYGFGELFGDQEINRDLTAGMAKVMHEAGLSKAQAHRMAKAYDEIYQAETAKREQEFQAEMDRAEASVSPEKLEMGRRLFRLFGLPEDERKAVSRAVESSLGVERAINLFATLAHKIGEDRLVDGADPVGGVSSPAGAERRMAERMNDKSFLDRYLQGEPTAVAEIEELAKRVAQK